MGREVYRCLWMEQASTRQASRWGRTSSRVLPSPIQFLSDSWPFLRLRRQLRIPLRAILVQSQPHEHERYGHTALRMLARRSGTVLRFAVPIADVRRPGEKGDLINPS